MNSKKFLNAKNFKNNKFCVIRNFIPQEQAIFLYEYTKIYVNSVNFKKEKCFKKWDPDWDGHWDCIQAPGTFSKYGDPIADNLGLWTLKNAEEYTGYDLNFTYSYWRLYEKGDVLEYHRDRKSCDVSATVCLGWDDTNLKDKSYHWSFYVESENKEEIRIDLNPGDAVFYRGCELFHWRNRCEVLNHSQVFLHYNTKQEKDSLQRQDKNAAPRPGDGHILDGRIYPGIPIKYQRNEYRGGLYEWHLD